MCSNKGTLVQVTGVQLRHTWCNGGDCIMMQVDSLEVTGCTCKCDVVYVSDHP